MKYFVIFLLIFLTSGFLIAADNGCRKEPEGLPASFTFQIKSDKKLTDSITVLFWSDYVSDSFPLVHSQITVSPTDGNVFHFTLPPFSDIGRIKIVNREISRKEGLLDEMLVEPGDSIVTVVSTYEEALSREFSGLGAEKYRYFYEANPTYRSMRSTLRELEEVGNIRAIMSRAGSWKRERLDLLKDYRLSDSVDKILRADIFGVAGRAELETLIYVYINAVDYRKQEALQTIEQSIRKNNKRFSIEAERFSKGLIEYLFICEKFRLSHASDANFDVLEFVRRPNYSFDELAVSIEVGYQGVLRDRLFMYALLQAEKLVMSRGSYAEEVDKWHQRALEWVTDPYVRTVLLDRHQAMGRGRPAFDFSLPDTKGNMVSLRDFRGKVILLEFWSTGCTACRVFKKTFEKESYPILRDNPNFVFISVGVDKNHLRWLENIEIYSHPEFVNLFTEGQGVEHPLVKYYNLSAVPYAVLIDKSGKVSSVMVPTFASDLLSMVLELL